MWLDVSNANMFLLEKKNVLEFMYLLFNSWFCHFGWLKNKQHFHIILDTILWEVPNQVFHLILVELASIHFLIYHGWSRLKFFNSLVEKMLYFILKFPICIICVLLSISHLDSFSSVISNPPYSKLIHHWNYLKSEFWFLLYLNYSRFL